MAMTKMETYKMMFRNYPDIVSVSQLSQMLGISEKTIYRLIKADQIEYLKIGHSYKFAKVHIFNYLHII